MRLLFITLLSVLTLTAWAQKKSSKIDSLKRVINTKVGDEKSMLLLQLSQQYGAPNPDSALLLIKQALDETKTKEAKGKVYLEKALLYWFLEKEPEKLAALDTSYQLLAGVNDSIAANVLHYKHVTLQDKGKYKQALQIGHKELALRKTLPSRDKELNALLQIGYTYDRMGDYQKAIEWYHKGFTIKDVKNEEYIGRNYGLIGIAYDELKDYKKAVFYNLKAIEHFKKHSNSIFLHSWYSNLGNTYIKLGRLDLAERYTLLALEDTKKKRYATIINLGKIKLEKGDLKSSETILKNVLADLEKAPQPIYLSEAYFRLHELYKKKKDYEMALSYFEQYKTLEDERLSITKTKQLNELTIQYESAEKERQLLIQRAQLAEHELELRNRSQWIFGLSTLALIVAAIGLMFYKQQKLKNIQIQKENELELILRSTENQNKLQEQRISISRDLHDNIGSQLTFIISAIDNLGYRLTDEQKLLKSKLNTIKFFASDTINELRDTIWAMNKSGITIKNLQVRIANFIEKAKESQQLVQISFVIDENFPNELTFNALQGLNIYRIIQEAINNALKYAEAKHIKVHIRQENSTYFLISDDGKGFLEKDVELGNGLLNMRKRALQMDTELILLSTPNNGTSIGFYIIQS